MTIRIVPFDAADYLEHDNSKLFILNDAFGSGNAAYIANAVGVVARASGGLSLLERLTGIKRQTLHKSLGEDGNPTLETLVSVLNALNIRLRAERIEAEDQAPRELATA